MSKKQAIALPLVKRNTAALVAPWLIATFTALVFLPALWNGFVNWDDNEYVYENLGIRSLSLGFFKWALTAVAVGHWQPLTQISYALDYSLWGLNPMGYHLTSVIFHVLSTCLVFFIMLRLVGLRSSVASASPDQDKGALVSAVVTSVLFGIHPLRVESVVWVSERKDVLCTFFYLASVLAYLGYAARDSGNRFFRYLLSIVLFVLALLSKSMAMSLPFTLLILDYGPLNRLYPGKSSAVVLEKLPFFALSLLGGVGVIWSHGQAGMLASSDMPHVLARFGVSVRALMFYLGKLALPMDLAPVYPTPLRAEVFGPAFYASLALVAGISVFCARMASKNRMYLSAWLYYVVTLIPVLGLLQVQARADRYTYLPCLGPILLIGAGVGYVYTKISKKWQEKAFIAFLTILTGLLAVKTVSYVRVWKDSLTLWSYELRLYPKEVGFAHNNLGLVYKDMGRVDEAANEYATALRLSPDFPEAHVNLGIVYGEQGRMEDAVREYRIALGLDPSLAQAHNNLGFAYCKMGRVGEAIKEYETALKLRPDFRQAQENLAACLLGATGVLKQP